MKSALFNKGTLLLMKKNKIFILLLLTTTIFNIIIFAENSDSTLTKIKKNEKHIKNASQIFDVNKNILSAVIYIERRENYTWEDVALDEYLAQVGLNSSIGFCQVKLKTAYWIEVQLNDTNSTYFPGDKYYQRLIISKTPEEIVKKLQTDSINILYAAAYLRIMEKRWEKEGYPINNKPEILGTLYSTGLFYRSGEERKPNSNPKSNWFGKLVKANISKFN